MRVERPSAKRLLVLIGLVVPALAWAIVKPVRILVPSLAGVTCTDSVCVDVEARFGEAHQLASEARAFVQSRLGPMGDQPRTVFCSTDSCADYFGLGARSALTLGRWGTVIGPRAWKAYYVRHEMIHQAQALRLGVLPLLLKPDWIVEGMAYGLSEDPRAPLAEPFESQRRQFLAWYGRIQPDRIWAEVDKQ